MRRHERSAARGCVYLVGAGPGDPGLLTRRGAECLAMADVVIYDRLVHPELLALAPAAAERVFVGKERGGEPVAQRSINRLLIDRARRGRAVVRLKGGDPFIFGRGAEEALALAMAGVPCEVVSGVTSAIAAPAAAGIPLTDRRYASSVTFVTGQEGRGRGRIRWDRLADGSDTLVLLMAVRQLPRIVRELLRRGRSPSTPVAVVQWGTMPQQETVIGTLGTIVEQVQRAGIRPPAVAVVGEVVRLQRSLAQMRRVPLAGCRVVVTRASEQAGVLSALLVRRGATPVEIPLIRFAAPSSYRSLDRAIRRIGQYQWAIFTSVNGVDAFLQRLARLGTDIRASRGVRICAIGPKTAGRFRALGVTVDYQPATFTNAAIARGMRRFRLRGQRVVIVRAEEAPELLPTALRALGAMVDVVPAYRTLAARPSAESLARVRQADVVTLTSSSTARAFVQWVTPKRLAAVTQRLLVASIGPVTTATARAMGLRVDIEARRATIEGLVEAVERTIIGRRARNGSIGE